MMPKMQAVVLYQYYDTATVTSTSGSVSFDRSVYPVPFSSTDLHTGSGGTTLQTESVDP